MMKKAIEMLSEFFPSFVIIVEDRKEGKTEQASASCAKASYYGGYHNALGLIENAKHDMLRSDEEYEDDGDGE